MSLADREFSSRVPTRLLTLGRIHKYLDQWAALTVVRGLQGYGKTTLVASWLRAQPESVRCAWITATATTEPADILSRVEQTISERLEGQKLVVVIDDAQHLRDQALLEALVEKLREHQHFHLVVCGRGRHPIELPALGVVDTVLVPARELLLTVDEIAQLSEVMDAHLSIEQIQTLHTELGGWMAALRLVLEETLGSDGGLALSRACSYLRDVVLQGIEDTVTLREVMHFALARRLTHGLIRGLADGRDPEQLIALIEGSGLAERRYLDHDVELVFPAYICTTLRARLTADDPDQARAMHRRLARWYADHDPMSAFHHAAAGEDWEHLDQLWTDHSTTLCMSEAESVARVLGGLPQPVITVRPGMLLALAMTSTTAAGMDSDGDGRLATLRAYVESGARAEAAHLAALSLHDLLFVGTGQMIGLRLVGKALDAEQLGNQIEVRANELLAGGSSPGDRLGWFHLQRGLTRTLLARHPDATRSYRTSWQHRDRAAAHIPSNVAANLALTYAVHGESGEARTWLAHHGSYDTSADWGHYLTGIGAHLANGLLALDRLDTAMCHFELEHLGDGSVPVELWPYVAYLKAQYGLQVGDRLAALATLDAARRAHSDALASEPAAAALLVRARADLLIAAGQAQRARRLLDGRSDVALLAVPLARISLLSGDHAGARRYATDALWSADTPERERLEMLLISAQAAHRRDEAEQAAELTTQAVALYERSRLLRPFAAVPADERTALLARIDRRLDPADAVLLAGTGSPYPPAVDIIALTKREQLLVAELTETASRQTMAAHLFVSINTVRSQLSTLYRKLGVDTRDQALLRLRELGLT